MKTSFCKSNDGLIHIVSTSNPEYTLCGDAFDLSATDRIGENNSGGDWKLCRPQPVTCPRCAAQILTCRGVRIKLDYQTSKAHYHMQHETR
jgi:hypothetical protein